MKTTNKFLSMAALALVGAVMTGCSSSDDLTDNTQPQQSGTTGNTVTLTTTVNLGDNGTRALTSTGVKTFAVGEQVALAYWNTSINQWDKAVSQALTDNDISADGKTATLTFTLYNPEENGPVEYCYPAAMANVYGQADLTKLATQTGGTLASLAANYDLAKGNGNLDGLNLPSLTLENQLAILAITLKDEAGTSDITSSTTKLTVSDGTNTYNVNRSAAEGPIYVAIRPTTSATIDITATSGTKNYTKTLTTKTYEAGNGYPVSWRMAEVVVTDLSTIYADYVAQDGEVLTGTLASNVKISIADGATVTLKNVNITNLGDGCDWAGINCPGNATLVLEGTNEVCAGRDDSGNNDYPGIYIAPDNTLTIQGDGTLTAYSVVSSPWGAGIGGGYMKPCGNIVINSGNITATGGKNAAGIGGGNGSCGNITINGGTITATGGEFAAGIGGGYGSCGNITISGGNITATGGNGGAGIGSCYYKTCGSITISGGTVEATGGNYAAGIGGGSENKEGCGTITITSGVTSVTATKGSSDAQSIGKGALGSDITVTIDAGANVTQN